jgi:hypothetical protein
MPLIGDPLFWICGFFLFVVMGMVADRARRRRHERMQRLEGRDLADFLGQRGVTLGTVHEVPDYRRGYEALEAADVPMPRELLSVAFRGPTLTVVESIAVGVEPPGDVTTTLRLSGDLDMPELTATHGQPPSAGRYGALASRLAEALGAGARVRFGRAGIILHVPGELTPERCDLLLAQLARVDAALPPRGVTAGRLHLVTG